MENQDSSTAPSGQPPISQADSPTRMDPSQIYPTSTKSATPVQTSDESKNRNMKADTELTMAGVYRGHKPASYRPIDIVGGLIILSGAISLIIDYRSAFSLVFNILYIALGIGILARTAMARTIVIFFSAIGLIFNILGLFQISAFSSGKQTIVPILSTLLSIAVQITVLSVLTWHQAEREFH